MVSQEEAASESRLEVPFATAFLPEGWTLFLPFAGQGPLAGPFPIDLQSLEQGMQRFFAGLDGLGERLVDGEFFGQLMPWLLGVGISMGAALRLASRMRRTGPNGRIASVPYDSWTATSPCGEEP